MLKKKLTIFMLAVSVFLIGCGEKASEKKVEEPKVEEKSFTLKIAHINDTHGRVKEGKYDGMGLARISTMLKDLGTAGDVLFLDAGDTFHGTVLASLDEGESIVKVLNAMELDVLTPGNHDFNYGQERLKELEGMANFEIVSANLTTENGEKFLPPYTIEDVNGVKVGIFGVSTPETAYKTNPKNVEGLSFGDPSEYAAEAVKELQAANVDFIIALVHLGIDQSTLDEYQSIALAKNIEGIDLIIDGHSHTELKNGMVVNGTTIVQAGEYDKNLGVVDVIVENGEVSIQAKLIGKEVAEEIVEPDTNILALIEEIDEAQKVITEVEVGETPYKLEGSREMVRTGETNLANLITDAMIWKTGADIAITNGGGIRDSIPKGTITVGEIITVLPFGNYVITKNLTGAEVKMALEHGLSKYPESNGALSQVAGVIVEFDPSLEAGSRVQKITLDTGEELVADKTYLVATNDFMAAGGDGYEVFKDKKEIGNYEGLDEILREYIEAEGIDHKEAKGRLKPVK